ncbi:mechanosensitive ion channel (plasmid) [Lichenicola cladoniae]|uniref:Mechanosensitive ion channel n=1 Tax=Lichenicola cladoniae TaxID=1484109 RepID=A0A6M8HYN8_9PROT|nr:mechanosensitive ion channel domain-containing protein [Lichenicola cladoniae]NPD70297.1 mechanosensitive ion channel [Acetobacteraceae bacterium]QKE93211.1 mechanosensitive ion channel [Lichenicola cladoniae]
MNSAFILHHLDLLTAETLPWLRSYVLAWDVLLQTVVALLGAAMVRLAAPRVAGTTTQLTARMRVLSLRPMVDALGRALPWMLFLLLLWFAQLVLANLGMPTHLLRLVSSLVMAWIVIRLSTTLVRNASMARLFAAAAWVVAALNIAGLIAPTGRLLGEMAFPIGTLHLSVLLLLKGAALLVALIWLANLISTLVEHRLNNARDITPAMQVLASKLLRAGLLTLAVVAALGAVGIDLTAFAVFSGAIGVGLGFGLQKVVSNLVSGVILLLDRSIKPGDVIQLDDTYGWITRLNARFVSVVTRDGTEHLIPNEDLITQRVVNWTYSNDLVRLKVAFGISYSADVHLARRLATEALSKVERVLEAPAPICLLVGLGDSSVDLELRFWIADPRAGTANVRSDVLLGVWDAFHAANIEFPFPQRDLNVRDPEALAKAFAQASAAALAKASL